jgi:predicted helicase
MISNNGFLTNRVLRGLRKALLDNANHLDFLDLHGNRSKSEVCADGSPDDNVFDINQGVCISVLRKLVTKLPFNTVKLGNLWGARSLKYGELGNSTIETTLSHLLHPKPPYYAIALVDGDIEDEYRSFVALDDAMPFNKAGFVSGRDEFAVDFDSDPLERRIRDFLNPSNSDLTIRDRYSIKDAGGYELGKRRKPALTAKLMAKDTIQRVQHRPFDYRFVAYSEAVLTSPQKAAMRQLLGERNLAFCLSRGAEIIRGWEHIFCTRALVQHHTVSLKEVNYVFPLNVNFEDTSLAIGASKSVNFAPQFLKALTSRLSLGSESSSNLPKAPTPEDIFYYAYGIFFSPSYRTRYAEFLKTDFPRLPLTKNPKLFHALARLGGKLVALHLMETPSLDQFITTYAGPKEPEVERIGWSNDTVWLDAVAAKKRQPSGSGSIGFHGVPEPVWNFHVGGYQVCEKWLKDRKGRTLSVEDITHYQKIIVAISETICLMGEIDATIEKCGGWPGDFVATES